MTNPDRVRRNVQLGVSIKIDAVNIGAFIVPAPGQIGVGRKYRRNEKTKRNKDSGDHHGDPQRSMWILAVRSQTTSTKMMRRRTRRR